MSVASLASPLAFTSYINFLHKTRKDIRREHRTVVLPDYQGLGIATKFRDFVADLVVGDGFRFSTVLSHPALIASMKKNPNWKLTRKGRCRGGGKTFASLSKNRITTSWEFVKK